MRLCVRLLVDLARVAWDLKNELARRYRCVNRECGDCGASHQLLVVEFVNRQKETRLSVECHFVTECGVVPGAVNGSWRCGVHGKRGATEMRRFVNGTKDGTRQHVAAEVARPKKCCRPAL